MSERLCFFAEDFVSFVKHRGDEVKRTHLLEAATVAAGHRAEYVK